jgi:hypothetical protein
MTFKMLYKTCAMSPRYRHDIDISGSVLTVHSVELATAGA